MLLYMGMNSHGLADYAEYLAISANIWYGINSALIFISYHIKLRGNSGVWNIYNLNWLLWHLVNKYILVWINKKWGRCRMCDSFTPHPVCVNLCCVQCGQAEGTHTGVQPVLFSEFMRLPTFLMTFNLNGGKDLVLKTVWRVTRKRLPYCPLWVESTGDRWNPRIRPVMRGLDDFYVVSQNKLLNKQSVCRWF